MKKLVYIACFLSALSFGFYLGAGELEALSQKSREVEKKKGKLNSMSYQFYTGKQ